MMSLTCKCRSGQTDCYLLSVALVVAGIGASVRNKSEANVLSYIAPLLSGFNTSQPILDRSRATRGRSVSFIGFSGKS